jgi:hypothetical protein
MYLFSGKIKCLDCNGNYRALKERGKSKYICSKYHNYRTCERYMLSEDYLYELVEHHYHIILIKSGVIDGRSRKVVKPEIEPEELMKRVVRIEVSPKNKTFTIYYTDDTKTKISPTHDAYWAE